jgi:hypothetical protein
MNGNFVPLELGTLTINNTAAPFNDFGDISLFSGDYLDSNFATQPATTPQVLAAIIPEPGTLVLLGWDGWSRCDRSSTSPPHHVIERPARLRSWRSRLG